MTNDERDRIAIDALCRCIVPAAYDGTAPAVELAAAVEARIATLPRAVQVDLRLALRIMDHPASGLATAGRPVRFSRVDTAAQERRLRAWGNSAIPTLRTIYQAWRRLIVSTYYSIPEVLPAIGYAGPLRGRAAVVPWEGPLPEATGDVIASAAVLTAAHADRWPSQTAPPNDTVLRCDVCVIGSGAGGAVMAARLAEAGRSVVLLEEGGHYDTADFTDREREMTPRLYADAGARTTNDGSVGLLQGRCIGGGTTVNWMLMLRPQAWVMDEWETGHGAAMLGPRSLVPALERVEAEVGAGFLPEDAHSASNRIILDGAAALGWKAETARINARGCVRAGTCGLGCSHGAKRSAGVVYLPRAAAAGAVIIPDARADRVAIAADRKRVHVTRLDRETGQSAGTFEVDAENVVLAAGAIGTPTLLQRSGLGSRAVGNYLRLHPTTALCGRYDRVMYGAAGVPQSSLLSEFMYGDDGYGFWVECPPLLPALAAVAVGGFGSAHRDAMLAFPQTAALIVLVRDGRSVGHSSGRVRTGRYGRTHIDYRVSALDRKQLALGIEAAARLHLAAGAREVATLHTPARVIRTERDVAALADASLAPNRLALFSAHVNGTCRMGDRADSSGCNENAEVHGARGIYVADGSLFPTAPGVNPQAAIMAIASLVAERIV